jgi:dethiobiotin synthetase
MDLQLIFKAYRTLCGKYDFMVIEGIGGVLVPLASIATRGASRTYFVTDLIKDLKLPAVVVTRPSLGTINHTLLTVNQLLSEGIDVAGVIINFSAQPEGTIAEKTNPQALRELCPVPVLGIIPCLKDISAESIEDIATGCIDVSALIHHA